MNTPADHRAAPHFRQSRNRAWLTAGLLGFGVLVNYFDRVNLSVAQAALRQQWGVGDVAFGYLSSAYSWTYTLLQMPMGALLDSFGVRTVSVVAAFLWSAATFAAAAAPGLRSFFLSRLLLGVAEAPTFPANAKAVADWFPPERRGLPTAMFDAGAKLGPAVGVPVIGLVLFHFGWRASFAFTGALSFVYFLGFAFFYKDGPRSALPPHAAQPAAVEFPSQPAQTTFRHLLTNRKVLGLALGGAGYAYSFYLLLSWLPSYLMRSLHMDLLHSVAATAVPWGFATAGDLIVGGWLVDFLIARGHAATKVRQVIVSTGLALALAIVGAAHTANPHYALAWITLALTGLATSAPVMWQIPALIAPPGAEGRVGGILNCAGNTMGIIAPIVTGYIVVATHAFTAAFTVAGVMVALGVFGYTVVLGRIHPIAP